MKLQARGKRAGLGAVCPWAPALPTARCHADSRRKSIAFLEAWRVQLASRVQLGMQLGIANGQRSVLFEGVLT